MSSKISALFFATIFFISGCNSYKSSSSGVSCTSVSHKVSPFLENVGLALDSNQTSVSVGCGYIDEPCVSVTICEPGSTTNCQTINNILLDTGSYGLRLFSSVVSISLTTETNGLGDEIAECTSFADGSAQWGPVKTADVTLGAETASSVPIEIVDSTYASVPADCTGTLDTSPADDGYNGILGVGVLTQDCGSACTSSASNGLYYQCSGTTCTGATATLAEQVTNPVSMLTTDNNGVILTLPSISSSGSSSASGTLTLGIDTETNNSSTNAGPVLQTNSFADFVTVFNGITYGPYNGTTVLTSSFIDSGSNGLFFPDSSIATCGSSTSAPGFFCPGSSITCLDAAMEDDSNNNVQTVSFGIGNANDLVNTGNTAFDNVGAPQTGMFDWGLPFFFGRSVFVGIDGKTSNLGTGPYWAFY